jgi:hypothetical protein
LAFVSTVMNLRFPYKAGNLLRSWGLASMELVSQSVSNFSSTSDHRHFCIWQYHVNGNWLILLQ